MDIQNIINSYRATSLKTNAASSQGITVLDSDPHSYHIDGVESAFLKYMSETPEERMVDAWLASHNLTREDLAAMTPEKRAAVIKQMEEEIKQQLKQKEENKIIAALSART